MHDTATQQRKPAVGDATSELARRIRGTLHKPGDPAYEEACRIWNAMIERRPAFVVRPRDAADVAATIGFANEHGLPLSVRGGGHNVAGAALSDGGITIDMSQRRAVEVDAARGAVRVEPGATWKDVDAATQPHGLVVPSGIISATGVAGLTLGAGFGWTRGNSASPPTTFCASRWSPPTASAPRQRAKAKTPTCSGRCAAAAAISAW